MGGERNFSTSPITFPPLAVPARFSCHFPRSLVLTYTNLFTNSIFLRNIPRGHYPLHFCLISPSIPQMPSPISSILVLFSLLALTAPVPVRSIPMPYHALQRVHVRHGGYDNSQSATFTSTRAAAATSAPLGSSTIVPSSSGTGRAASTGGASTTTATSTPPPATPSGSGNGTNATAVMVADNIREADRYITKFDSLNVTDSCEGTHTSSSFFLSFKNK